MNDGAEGQTKKKKDKRNKIHVQLYCQRQRPKSETLGLDANADQAGNFLIQKIPTKKEAVFKIGRNDHLEFDETDDARTETLQGIMHLRVWVNKTTSHVVPVPLQALVQQAR